jgi:hypothetical protein
LSDSATNVEIKKFRDKIKCEQNMGNRMSTDGFHKFAIFCGILQIFFDPFWAELPHVAIVEVKNPFTFLKIATFGVWRFE